MQVKNFPKRLLITLGLTLSLCLSAHAEENNWQPLDKGLDYLEILAPTATPWGRIHVFRIDPKRYQLKLAFARDQADRATSVKNMAIQNNALIAINGGFFTPDLQPIGLRINEGKVKARIKGTSWWGVFAIRGNTPRIFSQRAFRHNRRIHFAVQGGPRLVINGRIPKLKPGIAERTAIGITRDNKVILLVTDKAPMSTKELAQIIKAPDNQGGLACQNALNLDGGSSSQLYAQINDFTLHVSGFSNVTDAVMVLPTNKKS